MESEISSRLTFYWKYLFPIPFAVVGSVWAYSAWFGKHPTGNGAIPLDQIHPVLQKYISLLYPVVLPSFPALICGGIKRVRLSGDRLYISNYIKEIVVPISNIKDVKEFLGQKMSPAKIYFYGTTDFGTEIQFIPRGAIFPWIPSPIVARLRKLANLP